jgi:hypothetical protein
MVRVQQKSTRQNHRYRRIIRPSLRKGFNGFLRALPGDHAWLPPSPVRRESVFTTLAPASERQNHTTSPSAQATFVSRAICVHRIPASRIVTIGRNVPLHRGGMRERIGLICPTPQARTRATDWHDGQFAHGVNAETARSGNLSWHRGVSDFHGCPANGAPTHQASAQRSRSCGREAEKFVRAREERDPGRAGWRRPAVDQGDRSLPALKRRNPTIGRAT